jgi:hypothetical protein
MYRLKSDADIQQEMEETELDAEDDEETIEFDGWIYAFSFPVLVKNGAIFPIKIASTTLRLLLAIELPARFVSERLQQNFLLAILQ